MHKYDCEKSFAFEKSTITFAGAKIILAAIIRGVAQPGSDNLSIVSPRYSTNQRLKKIGIACSSGGEGFEIMKCSVYILESKLDGSFYIGQTSNLEERVNRHNKGLNRYTKHKKPWKLIYSEECTSRSGAMKLEKKLKSWKKRDAIINYIKNNSGCGAAW